MGKDAAEEQLANSTVAPSRCEVKEFQTGHRNQRRTVAEREWQNCGSIQLATNSIAVAVRKMRRRSGLFGTPRAADTAPKILLCDELGNGNSFVKQLFADIVETRILPGAHEGRRHDRQFFRNASNTLH